MDLAEALGKPEQYNLSFRSYFWKDRDLTKLRFAGRHYLEILQVWMNQQDLQSQV
jgi:hypothetical protein